MEKTFADAAIKFIEMALEELEAKAYAEAMGLAESACKLAGISAMMLNYRIKDKEKA